MRISPVIVALCVLIVSEVPSTPDTPPTLTTEKDDMRGIVNMCSRMTLYDTIFLFLVREVEMTKAKVLQLHKCYVNIASCAEEYIMSTNVSVHKLCRSLLWLPPALKKEHKALIKEAKADIKVAESVDDVFDVVGRCDFLNYSLLKYIIDMYGSDKIKEEMTNYAMQIKAFRKETRLQVFSEASEDKPEKDDGKFSLLVTKHDMDWATATLEDVENFRIDVCRELSLYTFSLNLSVVARGCVEVTWQVPRSLVTYIQALIKPSSPSMMKHHVSTLTIDGFIAYHSTTGIFITL